MCKYHLLASIAITPFMMLVVGFASVGVVQAFFPQGESIFARSVEADSIGSGGSNIATMIIDSDAGKAIDCLHKNSYYHHDYRHYSAWNKDSFSIPTNCLR